MGLGFRVLGAEEPPPARLLAQLLVQLLGVGAPQLVVQLLGVGAPLLDVSCESLHSCTTHGLSMALKANKIQNTQMPHRTARDP